MNSRENDKEIIQALIDHLGDILKEMSVEEEAGPFSSGFNISEFAAVNDLFELNNELEDAGWIAQATSKLSFSAFVASMRLSDIASLSLHYPVDNIWKIGVNIHENLLEGHGNYFYLIELTIDDIIDDSYEDIVEKLVFFARRSLDELKNNVQNN